MRVLIVDDAQEICQMHERIVKMLGHDARCVQDGPTAIEEAKRFRPDVVLLDICMPGMDGWEVAEQLRDEPATQDVRLVAVTAMTTPECQERCKQVGFDAHFGKPIRMAQWAAVLSG